MADVAHDDMLSFEVDSSLLVQLGEQLVARRSIALAELIKNAYDADATRVRVVMQGVRTPTGSILIDDDGTGMTLDEVRRGWMRIATTAKNDEPISTRYGRTRTGAKGIGRFAARRLGDTLLVSSTAEYPEGVRRCIEVAFDWKRDFVPGTDIGGMKLAYTLKNVPSDTPTGTALLIEALGTETWEEQDIQEVQRDLLSLTPPFDLAEPLQSRQSGTTDPGFSVALEAPEFPDLEGELRDQFLEAAWGVLSGHVDAEGRPHYCLEINETGEQASFSPDVTYSSVGQVVLRVHYVVRLAERFEGLAFGVRDAQRYGKEFGGVRLYMDGFRVFPYGDPGDDWLKLDYFRARRMTSVQSLLGQRLSDMLLESVPSSRSDRGLLLTPGNNQLFGAIFASRTGSPGIVSNISREQVLENPAFDELRRFVQIGIFWMTLQYARVSSSRRRQKATGESASDLIAAARQTISSTPMDARTKETALAELQRAEVAVHEEREEHIGQLQLLRVLSATGAAVSLFNHQISAIGLALSAVRNRLESLRRFVTQGGESLYEEVLESARKAERLFREQHSQLSALLGQRGRRRAVRVNLHELADQVLDPFRSYCEELGIALQNSVPSGLTTPPMYRAELYAVLLHLLTNAIKAVQSVSSRSIAFLANAQTDTLVIKVLDTGVGIDETKREEVFSYFVSYSAPHELLGTGTGLGLAVVRDIISEYGGEVHFVDTQDPWRTCVEIRLPLRT
ncbi:MAG: sensor histidine kinase [Anaerolineae bacterium]